MLNFYPIYKITIKKKFKKDTPKDHNISGKDYIKVSLI